MVTKGNAPLLTPEQAQQDINEFASNFKILYPDEISFQKLHQLISQYKPKGLLIHDYEILAIGLAYGINNIASFNISDFAKVKGITIIN